MSLLVRSSAQSSEGPSALVGDPANVVLDEIAKQHGAPQLNLADTSRATYLKVSKVAGGGSDALDSYPRLLTASAREGWIDGRPVLRP